MTAAQAITVVVALAFLLAFLYKVGEVRRDPWNLGAWAVLVILLALAITTTFRDGAPAFVSVYGVETVGVLIRNIAQVIGFAGLQLWHLRNLPNVRPRRLWLEGVALAGVIAGMTLVALTLPEGVGLTWTSDNLAVLQVLVFYYVAGGYVLYCLAMQFCWNVRFAREFQQRLLKISAVITALGDLSLFCTQLSRQISQNYTHFVAPVRPRVTTVLELGFISLGAPLLIIGLLLPPIVGAGREMAGFLRLLRRYRALRCLHTAVQWAYPGLIRPSTPAGDWIREPLGGVARLRRPVEAIRIAYTERLQQCRDGYARSQNGDGEGGRPAALAQVLDALPETHEAVDLSDETQQTAHLIAVSRALSRTGNTPAILAGR